MPEAAFWQPLPEGRLRCELCPHACIIAPGKAGICRVRKNVGGRLELPRYGLVSALALDPIEKKPLYHFLPGSSVLSAGFFGCNLRCPFCQNWEIAQTEGEPGAILSPEALVHAALASGSPSLAFTYSEPTVHFEYLLEAAALARKAGLKTVLVTNGHLSEAPARALLPLIDAANVDLKCWSAEAYARILGGSLEAVLAFIRLAANHCHLELTTLVVPGLDEWEGAIVGIAAFVTDLSAEIPLHLSAYHPAYRFEAPPTSPSLLGELASLARRSLRNVHVGNLGPEAEEESCASCGALLLRRKGYTVKLLGLVPTPGGPGKAAAKGRWNASCAACGAPAPYILPTVPGDSPSFSSGAP